MFLMSIQILFITQIIILLPTLFKSNIFSTNYITIQIIPLPPISNVIYQLHHHQQHHHHHHLNQQFHQNNIQLLTKTSNLYSQTVFQLKLIVQNVFLMAMLEFQHMLIYHASVLKISSQVYWLLYNQRSLIENKMMMIFR